MDEATTKEADEGQKARKGKVIEKSASGRGRKGSASRFTRLGHLDTWTLGLT